MSDYELALRFNECLSATGLHLVVLVAVVSACVPMGHLAGPRLPRPAMALLVAVYSGLAIPAGGFLVADLLRLREAAAGLLASHESLAFTAGLFAGLPGALFLISSWLVLLCAYSAGILLLTARRRTDRALVLEFDSVP